jgi:phage terminase small subunit
MAKLKLIDNTAKAGTGKGIQPPRPLGKDGAALWADITAEYRFDGDSAGIAMLALACEALDVVQACRREIDKHGTLIVNPAGGPVRDNPLLKIELQNRFYVTRTLEKLGFEPAKAKGRPAGTWNYEK